MKKNLFITIVLSLGLLACSEDEDPKASRDLGEATLVLNGKPAEFTVLAGSWRCDSDNLSLSITRLGADLTKGVSVYLGNFPAKEGKYALHKRESSHDDCILNTTHGSALAYGGETLVAMYGILEDKGPNELIITHYDSVAQRLEGHFQTTLAVEDKLLPIGNFEHPDTLRITHGTFVTDILPPEK